MRISAMPRWAFQIPSCLANDLAEFKANVERFKAGTMSVEEFRAFRVPMGVYEQRESGTYMLRVRCPAGGVLPAQLRRLAHVSKSFGNGILHVTTRQELQVHRVPLDAIHPALESLRGAGLATKGGGGNTVRNITACPDCGVCPRELFDVAPFAVALTERLIADPVSFQLPRKYKIAFSGCASDCAGVTVQDLGFITRRKDGGDGFAVYVAGGMGAKSRVAVLLHDFVPAAEAFLVAEAVKRVFNQHGERKNKHLARLRFLVERIGFITFVELYQNQLAGLRAMNLAPLQTRAYPGNSQSAGASGPRNLKAAGQAGTLQAPVLPEFSIWRQCHVRPQKHPGFFIVELPLPLGDIEAGKMAALADVVAAHGDRLLCATQSQNLALRWIAESELAALHQKLKPLELAEPRPSVLRNLVACAGASTCRLGICLSRGLAKAITASLEASNLDLKKLGDLKIQISGCPNSCGRHPVADIGLHGAARRVEGRLVPHYSVLLGGRVAEGLTRFGAGADTLPAKNVPAFLQDFLAAFLQSAEAPDFHRFIDNGGRKTAEELAVRYRPVPALTADQSFYFDWDAQVPFSLEGRGPGECSAGGVPLAEPGR
ncbi:MAG TPA: nitrite/sulfite reductase [Candidatus Binatia bacterium]|jgi:sulfite reductase (ferredoxin)|nr:nitrite/sulfite reductase [Candidatus Binatia bacterium]